MQSLSRNGRTLSRNAATGCAACTDRRNTRRALPRAADIEVALAKRALRRSIRELVRLDLYGVANPRSAPLIGGEQIAWALMSHCRAFSEDEYSDIVLFAMRHFDIPYEIQESLLSQRSGSGSVRAPDHRCQDFAERLRRLLNAFSLDQY